MSKLYYHVASDKRKWAIVSIVLVFVIAAIVLMPLTNMFTDWNKYCLFGHDYDDEGICIRCGAENLDEIKPNDDTDEKATALGGMELGNSTDNGITLMNVVIPQALYSEYDVSPTAETAFTLTATVTPDYATDKSVDFSIAWRDASSEWACDKNISDYLSLIQASDGDLTATLTCYQAFGEQAIITVTSRSNRNATATCTVDFKQRLLGTSMSLKQSSGDKIDLSTSLDGGTINVKFPDSSYAGYEYPISLDTSRFEIYKSDTYTIPISKPSKIEYYLKLSDSFIQVINSINTSYEYSMTPSTDWVQVLSMPWSAGSDSFDVIIAGKNDTRSNFAYYISHLVPEVYVKGTLGGYLSDQYVGFCRAINNHYYSPTTKDNPHFQIKIITIFDDETYETITDVKLSSVSLSVTGVGVTPGIVF